MRVDPISVDDAASSSHGKPGAPPTALFVVLALGLYLLTTSVFYPLGILSVFDAKRMLQLGMFAVLLAFALGHPALRAAFSRQLGRVPGQIALTIGLLFAIGVASSLRLANPGYALLDVSMFFVLILLVFVTAASRDLCAGLFDRWAIVMLAAMGCAVFVQELMGYIHGWVTGVAFDYERVLVHFANPRFYNQLQTWCIPLLAALPLLFPRTRGIRSLCIFVLSLQWFLVLSTGARGTVVGLSTAMLFIALWLPAWRRYWLGLQLAGIVFGIVLYVGVLVLNQVFVAGQGDFFDKSVGKPMLHTSGRSWLWSLALEDALDNPVLGTGPGRYACDKHPLVLSHPHNFVLRILSEWGFLALFLVLMLAIRIGGGLLIGLRRLQDLLRSGTVHGPPHGPGSIDTGLAAMLATSIVAAAIHACLSGVLIMPASQVAMVLVAGWMLSISGVLIAVRQNSIGRRRTGQGLLLAGLIIGCTQLLFAVNEAR